MTAEERMTELVVTIDGPAGSGKSTAARTLAERLQFAFLDTGAMYRGVAWKCLHEGVDLSDAAGMADVARRAQFELRPGYVAVDGTDVTEAIRSSEVTRAASIVAVQPAVREALVKQQQTWAAGKRVVTEGRDQGTVVFPDAACKFFLTACPEVRARRRYDELREQGNDVDFDELVREIRERDQRDESRDVAPLKPAADAELIDTSDLEAEQVVELLAEKVRSRCRI